MNDLMAKATPIGHGILAQVLYITPELAGEFLKRNVNNYRKIKPWIVKRYTAVLMEDEWALNGATIAFNANYELTDGQHRLLACVEAGRGFRAIVIYNAEESEDTDTGPSRSAADMLKHHNELNAPALAAALTCLNQYRHGMPVYTVPITNSELHKLLKANPELRRSVAITQRLKDTTGVTTVLAAFHYVFSSIDAGLADDFIGGLAGDTNPAQLATLRKRLINNRAARYERVNDRRIIGEWIVRTWNAWVEERSLAQVTARPDSAFPQISTKLKIKEPKLKLDMPQARLTSVA